jgi:hypothetical protein
MLDGHAASVSQSAMRPPIRVVVAVAALGPCLAAACGGQIQSMGADAATTQETSDSSVTGIVTVITNAGDGGPTGAPEFDAAEDSSDEPVETCRYLDAQVPSAPSHNACAIRLFSCAGGCLPTPDDVACDAASDCTLLIRPASCGSCTRIAIGVNGTRTIPRCPVSLCAPAINSPCVLLTETCDIVDDASVAGVECTDHQCVSYTATGSE